MVKIDASADLDWTNLPPQQRLGRIIGGKYINDSVDEAGPISAERPLTKVECDLPLTYTESVEGDGREWVVLTFAPADPQDPYNWALSRKWLYTSLLCGMTLFIGCATTVYSSTISRMVASFDRVAEIGQLGLFTFNMTCAIAPLFLAPFCELVGRYVIYVGAYLCFSLCFIGLALGRNIATILVLRTLLGLFGSVGTILVGGTFDDMFKPEDRAIPMSLFSYIAILGTVGAPIYAGFVDENVGWRWTEGIQGLANIPLLVVIVLFFRETRGGVTLRKRAQLLRKDTGDDRWVSREELEAPGLKDALYASSVKAIQMLCTEPVVFFFGLWIAFAWFITFLFLSVISITFSEGKHWAEGIAGLPYIGLVLGCTLAFGANFLQIRKYDNLRAKSNGPLPPENRLYGAMCGALFLPVGLFIYSFSQYPRLHWMGPMVGLTCICFGIFFIFESCYSYTSDCYGQSASSAIAGQGFMRNTLGAVSPLFAHQFFRKVHSQYAGLICSVVATGLTFLPYILFKFGPTIRAKSKRAIVYPADNGDILPDAEQPSPDDSEQISSPYEKERSQEEGHIENANIPETTTTTNDEKNRQGGAELHSSDESSNSTEDEVEDALRIQHDDE
ncbi:hypothetical protein BZL39_K04890 [Zygosaccharomyces parabailii]|nr:hypothetical protein BZL39_D07340 [Zygosaccharomyces parabailii]AQZ16898.1 hypothetical protein BZL39_K04890 [Zygosaccharomyces parabailii]